MKFRQRTLEQIANLICGNGEMDKPQYFKYRSSSRLTQFFQDCETDHQHDGTTRYRWVADALEKILAEPQAHPNMPPDAFCRVVKTLMDPEDCVGEGPDRPQALEALNLALSREGYQAFYGPDRQCYLKHVATNAVAMANPHRPFSVAEVERRERLSAYLDTAKEDQLIEEVLLPLFRQLGFHRISAAGHEDKALEYGKDVWMKYMLPTQHVLYFGVQAKKGKLDAAGATRGSNTNISEIHNQALMMLGHEIFDPETGKRSLVDHAFIVAGGEITKAARNWLGQRLDATKRSQIMFMDRDDILNLYIVTNLPLPGAATPAKGGLDDDIPF